MGLFVLLAVLVGLVAAAPSPPYLLSAPWTPFYANGTVNLAIIEKQVAFAAKQGVTHVWISGAMSQFDQLTVEERKALADAYVPAIRAHGMYSILHVGHQTIAYAQELARYAVSTAKPDAIAVMPPFAPEKPATLSLLVDVLAAIANEAPSLPFFYYHIPGITGIDYAIADLLAAARPRIPQFAGVKYVSADLEDFQACTQRRDCNSTGCDTEGRYMMLWAPAPKSAALLFGARGFVLAQSYLARWDAEMYRAWPQVEPVQAAQAQLEHVSALMHGGSRAIMKMLNIDLGQPRLPETGISQADYDALHAELTDYGFFKMVPPWPEQ